MANHPAEKDFGPPIRGKKPAHYDHVKKSGGPYEEGGGTGFNMQDDLAGSSAGGGEASTSSVGRTPPADSGEVKKPSGLVGGIDFTVPPYREGQSG